MEISVGALTYHTINTGFHFERCIGNCQLIANPLIDLGVKNHHAFLGANSIGRFMAGYRYNFPVNKFVSLTAGTYYQDNNAFRSKGLIMPYTYGDLMPVIGLDMNYKGIGLLASFPVMVLYWKF